MSDSRTSPINSRIHSLEAVAAPRRLARIALDANELRAPLPRPLSAALGAAVSRVDLRQYPDPAEADALRTALAERHGLTTDHVVLGVGSSDLLECFCRVVGETDAKVLLPAPSFSMYPWYVEVNARRVVRVAGSAHDLVAPHALRQQLAAESPVAVVLPFPNNPTGAMPSEEVLRIVLDEYRGFVVVDEAYADYAGISLAKEVARRTHLVVVRSFSKIGLAGCRIGYMLAPPELARAIAKVHAPYSVSSVGIAAARALLQHWSCMETVVQQVVEERERLISALRQLRGLRVHSSHGNFCLCEVDSGAADLADYLRTECDIAVRGFPSDPMLKDTVRITVGARSENEQLLRAIGCWLRHVGGPQRPSPRHDIPAGTFAAVITALATTRGNDLFAVFGDEALSNSELLRRVAALASGLSGLGVKAGDRVGLLLDSGIDFVVSYFSLAWIGAVMVPMHENHGRALILDVLRSLDASLVLVDDSWARRLQLTRAPKKTADTLDCPVLDTLELRKLQCARTTIPAAVASDEPCVAVLTSGSTGRPKCVLHSQRSLLHNALAVAAALKLGPDDRVLFPNSLSGMFGVGWTAVTLMAGAKMVIARSPDARERLRLIAAHGITVHSGSVEMFRGEIACGRESASDLGSLRTGIVGGQSIGEAFLQEVRTRLGLKLCYCYGMTEAAGAVAIVPADADDEARDNCRAAPIVGTAVRVVDDHDRDLAVGEVGEILVRGSSLALGYLCGDGVQPLPTREGWFPTEDLGYLDSQGRLTVLGRKRDRVLLGEHLVLLPEIETAITRSGKASGCAVINHDGRLHVFVTGCDDSGPALARGIPMLSRLKGVSIRVHHEAHLPLTVSGKLDRLRLAALLAAS